MNILRAVCIGLLTAVTLPSAHALAAPGSRVLTFPETSDVVRVGASSFTVTFTSASGGKIVDAAPAQFCYRLNLDRSCHPNAVLGSNPDASPASGEISMTDTVTVAEAVARAAREAADHFYYVRSLTIESNGEREMVNATHVLTLVDPKKVNLIDVSLYGEDGHGDQRRDIQVSAQAFEDGFVRADISFTGEGTITGWWEVHVPTDPDIRLVDRMPDASLTDVQLSGKQTFRPVQWFHRNVKAPALQTGHITLRGPSFKDLPLFGTGKFKVLLHVVRNDKEFGGGATSGMPLLVMTYSAATEFRVFADGFLGWPWFSSQPVQTNRPAPRLVWDTTEPQAAVARLTLHENDAPTDKTLNQNFADGRVDIPLDWLSPSGATVVGFEVFDAEAHSLRGLPE